jgi:hypothetical protein
MVVLVFLLFFEKGNQVGAKKKGSPTRMYIYNAHGTTLGKCKR